MLDLLEVDRDLTVDEFWGWLEDPKGGACLVHKDLGNGVYAGVKPLLFHWTLLTGIIGNTSSYEDRYCYQTLVGAIDAMVAWNGNGDPVGWHRHPRSGRRRPDGDPAREYVER